MRIGIIGAGFAGLAAAKVLTEFGHEVTAFDRTPDVGGVWSRTRRYPGLITQNDKDTYAFSDFPMPEHYPQWPTGEQVQAYLADYGRHFGLTSLLRLDTEVLRATPEPDGSWTLETKLSRETVQTVSSVARGAVQKHRFDFLVVANGTCSEPLVPSYPGVDEFRAGGGRVGHTSEFTDLVEAQNQDVVVVGYGKSSCDLAVAVSDVASDVTVVTRNLIWKMPRLLGNRLNYKYLLLTRLGEALFPYPGRTGVERFLHGRGGRVTSSIISGLQAVISRQLRLRSLGLTPPGRFTDIARNTISLVTEGFFSRVEAGRITVYRDNEIVRLLVADGRPSAQFSSGEIVPADLVVCGTGFRQRVPFLSEAMQAELTDERGNFELYHQVLPLSVPKLAFVGYNSSFFCPLGAELGAVWIADHLNGSIRLPAAPERRAQVQERLQWTEERTQGRHSHGTNVIPFSMHQIDEMLADLGVNVDRLTRIKQWLLPVDPGAYRAVIGQVHRRHGLARVTAAAQTRRSAIIKDNASSRVST